MHAVGMIAHSCGVDDPIELNKNNARIFIENCKSISIKDY
jgi:hypothetical protein